MLAGKTAFLFLLVCAIISLDPVAADGSCTKEQKENFVLQCTNFIKKNGPFESPPYFDKCCVTVRAVNRDMGCIYGLLSCEQKKEYDEDKILILSILCS